MTPKAETPQTETTFVESLVQVKLSAPRQTQWGDLSNNMEGLRRRDGHPVAIEVVQKVREQYAQYEVRSITRTVVTTEQVHAEFAPFVTEA